MKRGVVVAIVAAVIAWWGISLGRSLAPSKGQVTVQEVPPVPADENADAGKEREPQAVALKEPESKTVVADTPTSRGAFEFQAELSTYASIKSKALLDETEKVRRRELVHNGRLLRSVGERLLKAPMLSIGEQAAAIDLLVDGLRNGDTVAAQEALKGIVADGQVEDSSLSRSTREQLAGIKAEELYYWAALTPSVASDVPKLLPGPASRKIWENVQESHSNNLAESQMAAYELEAERRKGDR